MTTITAQTILRSRNAAAPENVLSTLLLRYPRWIHAEQRTHRVIPLTEDLEMWETTPSLMADPALSRNAASSRAIPVEKLINDVLENPAIPLYWGRDQRGMQAKSELIGAELEQAKTEWMLALKSAVAHARMLASIGAHKQIVNRLLEPFSHITVLVSATEWDNYLELRDHGDAEPHIQILAREIRKCLDDESTIQTLQPGEWHMPFIVEGDWRPLVTERWDDGEENRRSLNVRDWYCAEEMRKLSTARCASTSFKTVDGFDMTLERAEAIFDKLVTSRPVHASPLEHVAQADTFGQADTWTGWGNAHQHGNFVGFKQYRHMLDLAA